MADPKALSRKELAKFLPDHRAVRFFEQLQQIVPSDINELYVLVQESSIDANIGIAKANLAISMAVELQNDMEEMEVFAFFMGGR